MWTSSSASSDVRLTSNLVDLCCQFYKKTLIRNSLITSTNFGRNCTCVTHRHVTRHGRYRHVALELSDFLRQQLYLSVLQFWLLQQLGKDAAVPLSNSVHLADRWRIEYCIKQSKGKDTADPCPFRNGQIFNNSIFLFFTSVFIVSVNQFCMCTWPFLDSFDTMSPNSL